LHDQLQLLTVLLDTLTFALLRLGFYGGACPLNNCFISDNFDLTKLLNDFACFVAHLLGAWGEHGDHLFNDLLLALAGGEERVKNLPVLLDA